MKNLIKMLILVGTFFIMSTPCLARTGNIVLEEKIADVKLRLITSAGQKDIEMYKIKNKSTTDFLYSTTPLKEVVSGTYTEYIEPNLNISSLGLTQEEYKNITYIAYYGYGYEDRTSINWYVAAQYMIWSSLLQSDEYLYFIDENGNKVDLYTSEIATITENLKNREVLPSFAKTVYDDSNPKIRLYEKITLIDENDVLANYNIYPIKDANLQINENTITVSFNDSGDNDIAIDPKGIKASIPKIYYKENYAGLINRCVTKTIAGVVQYYVMYPSVTLQITSKNSTISKKGGIYGIYDSNNNLYATITTDDDGIAFLEELYAGEFYIQEIEAPPGYEPNPNKLYFTMNKENVELELSYNLIYKPVQIQVNDTNAQFQLYNVANNTLIQTLTTDEEGQMNISLPYGEYQLIQTSATPGYTLTSDFTFTVKEDSLDNYTLENQALVGQLQIALLDSTTNQPIALPFSFKILNRNTNTYLELNDSNIFKSTNEPLTLIVPYGDYEIVQIELPSNYTLKEQSYLFNISKTSENKTINIKATPYLEPSVFFQSSKTPPTSTFSNRLKIAVPMTSCKEFLIALLISTGILLIGVYLCNYEKKDS